MRTNLLRIAPLAAVAVLFAAPVSAQSASPLMPKYRFGLAAGANLANMSEAEGADARTGLVIGGTMAIRVSDQLSIQPELYYSQKGIKQTVDDPDFGTFEATLKNDYLEIPVLARYSFVNSGSVRPFVLAGPAVAMNLSCKLAADDGDSEGSVDCDEMADVSKVDLGGVLGGGLELPVGTRSMTLGARYSMGLNEVFKDSDSKNRALTFLVGFSF